MRVPSPRSAEVEPDSRADSGSGETPGLAARLAEGAKAGLVATLVMTAYRLPVSRSLPPTARFWAKFVSGGEPDDHPVAAIALHLLYGVIGGIAFAAITPADAPNEPRDESEKTAYREAIGLVWGGVYGLALSVFGERVMLERLLDMDPEVDERLVFHAGHLVYGLSLGLWFGSRTSEKE